MVDDYERDNGPISDEAVAQQMARLAQVRAETPALAVGVPQKGG